MRRNNMIGYLFQHTASLMLRRNEQVLQDKLGIGMSQFKILRSLQTQSNSTQRAIAVSLGQTEASISRQVKLMLEDGLLSTNVSPRSRREHIVTATPKGAKLTEAALEVLFAANEPAFDTLSEEQQQQLQDLLQRLHDQWCSSDQHAAGSSLIHPKKF